MNQRIFSEAVYCLASRGRSRCPLLGATMQFERAISAERDSPTPVPMSRTRISGRGNGSGYAHFRKL
jgi:hypothetical protein